jgi:anti-sigma28 factor (negative regulator of flagellin synthesis)
LVFGTKSPGTAIQGDLRKSLDSPWKRLDAPEREREDRTVFRFLSSCHAEAPKSQVMSMEAPAITAPQGSASTDTVRIAAERRARVRLLKDLVQHGLYRIDTERLADTLLNRYRVDLL